MEQPSDKPIQKLWETGFLLALAAAAFVLLIDSPVVNVLGFLCAAASVVYTIRYIIVDQKHRTPHPPTDISQ